MLPVGRWWRQGMPGDAAYKVDAMASTQAVKSLHHDKECAWELYPRSCWRHDTGTLSPLLPLMRESTSNQCIPLKRPYGTSKAEIWCFLRCHPEQSLPFWQKYRVAGHSKRQDDNVMLLAFCICGENAGESASLNAGSVIRNIGVFVALLDHYDDVIMSAIASLITSLTIVYSTVYSDVDQRKHQSSASLAFVWVIHRGPVNSPHKWPVTRKMFPFDDVIMTIVRSVSYPLTRGPFYYHGLTQIPACMNDYTHYKVWDEIIYLFPNFDGVAFGVWEWISN